uniref:Uncharacterized protein n=1 Tax=viral metagenome TaxID=1070528 RepID=A0A6C0C6J3_9ZZZZ
MEIQDFNYGQLFFMTLGFLPVMTCLPCWVVAKFLYEPYVKKLEETNRNTVDEPVPFEYQYPLDDSQNDGDPDRDYYNCIVLSNTPKGLVYMRYSKEEEGFEYWTDNAVDYKYLEAVARKYVTIFSCRNIYIDRFTLLKEKIQIIKKRIDKNKLEEESTENTTETEVGVFASLKSYNKSANKTEQTKITRNDVVCDKANKYLNRGKIKEAKFGKDKNIVETPTSTMSFSSWKLWKSKDI